MKWGFAASLALAVGGIATACVGSDPEASEPPGADAGRDSAGPSERDAEGGSSLPDAAMGETNVVNDIHVDGTRLRASYLTLEDGTKQFRTWYDSVLDAPCTFRAQGGDTYACVPVTEPSQTYPSFFSDFQCTEGPAHLIPGGCSRLPRFVDAELGAACFDDVFRSGPVSSGIWEMQNDVCTPRTEQGTTFRRGEAVPTSTLVTARLQEWTEGPAPAPGARVRAQFFHGIDGSIGFGRWVSNVEDAECTFGTQPFDAATRCYPIPTELGTVNAYADSSCTQLAVDDAHAGTYSCTGTRTLLGAHYTGTSSVCGYVSTGIDWYRVGAPFSGTTLYVAFEDGSCHLGPGVGANAALAGPKVMPTDFGEYVETPPSDAPTLQARYLPLPDGTRFRRGFYDGKHHTSCTFFAADDGVMRCLPDPIGNEQVRENLFTDAACTVPTLVGRRAAPIADKCSQPDAPPECADLLQCQPPEKLPFTAVGRGVCTFDYARRVFAVGDAAPPLFTQEGAACNPVAVASYEAYDLLTELPPTDFFAGTPTDPD